MSKPSSIRQLLAALLSLGAAFAILIHAGLPDRAEYTGFMTDSELYVAPEVGSQAPPFKLQTPASEPLALNDFRGEITIINFWATWCQPCRREMRELQQLFDTHRGNLRVLAVNLAESADAVRNWSEQLGLSYDLLLDPHNDVAMRYQIRGQPTTYLLDAAHRIQQVYYGPVQIDTLKQDLANLGKGA